MSETRHTKYAYFAIHVVTFVCYTFLFLFFCVHYVISMERIEALEMGLACRDADPCQRSHAQADDHRKSPD